MGKSQAEFGALSRQFNLDCLVPDAPAFPPLAPIAAPMASAA